MSKVGDLVVKARPYSDSAYSYDADATPSTLPVTAQGVIYRVIT